MISSISSMTGFSRLTGEHENWRWVWEAKSVNGRGLELRFRLPQGYDELEPALRKLVRKKLHRGSVSLNLNLQTDSGDARYRINETMLADAIAMVAKISANIKSAPPRAEGILGLRGVIEPAEEEQSEEQRQALFIALQKSFENLIDGLAEARASEGKAMGAVVAAHFDMIEKLTKDAAAIADVTPEKLRAKITAQIEELLKDAPVPEERLAQEAALLAVKADIREELDRLDAHVEAGRGHLTGPGAVGRQLDFLTQELNREANTLCSKSQDMTLKTVGLELKNVVDQLREQVQNIE